MIRADMHMHTSFSKDSLAREEDVLDAAVEKGLGAVAITDHDSVEGAFLAQKIARERKMKLQVIAGEEVSTDEGDLLVYFVKKRIAPGPLARVLAEVGKQKAVCSAAHPYDFARHGIALGKLTPSLLRKIDCVEVLNARVPLAAHNASAMKFALAHGKPVLAGSDAHHPSEIGRAYVEFADINALDAFTLVHATRKIGGGRASPFVKFHTRYAVLRKKLSWLFPTD